MGIEGFKQKKQRLGQVLSLLKKRYPRAECALHYDTPLQLLVATILSAQCTDKRVNQVTTWLFKKYPSSQAFAKAVLKKLEQDIYSTGFYHSKAKNIKGACQKIEKQFQGQVPTTLDALLTLPGVGRKTAHVILGTAFGISSGVVVDTHVKRLSNRLNFVKSKDPKKIELSLCQLLPKKDWIYFSHALIWHGRGLCKARRPLCHECFLSALCPKKGVS